MKTILFPTDFSSNASNAFGYAIDMAEKLNAKIILHHACHISALASGVPTEETSEARLFENASESMKQFISESALMKSKIKVEEYINFGLATDSIVSIAKEKDADLIVMGTKGATGIEARILGSIAASVIEKTDCPVLVVPDSAKFNGIIKIVFATDYHDNDIESISRLSEIAALFNAEILIVHMCEVGRTDVLERDQFKKFKDDVISKVTYPHLSFQFLVGLNVAFALNTVMEESHADMLAMSVRKRNFISKLFDKSITKKMVYHTQIPILSFHAHKN